MSDDAQTHEVLMYLAERQNYDEVRKFGDVPEEMMARGYIPEAIYLKTESWKKLGEPFAIQVNITATAPVDEELNTEGENNG